MDRAKNYLLAGALWPALVLGLSTSLWSTSGDSTMPVMKTLSIQQSDSVNLRSCSRLVFSESGRYVTFWDVNGRRQYLVDTDSGKIVARWRDFKGARKYATDQIKSRGVNRKFHSDEDLIEQFGASTIEQVDNNPFMQVSRDAACFDGDTALFVLDYPTISFDGVRHGRKTNFRYPIPLLLRLDIRTLVRGNNEGAVGRIFEATQENAHLLPFERYGTEPAPVDDSVVQAQSLGAVEHWPTSTSDGGGLVRFNGSFFIAISSGTRRFESGPAVAKFRTDDTVYSTYGCHGLYEAFSTSFFGPLFDIDEEGSIYVTNSTGGTITTSDCSDTVVVIAELCDGPSWYNAHIAQLDSAKRLGSITPVRRLLRPLREKVQGAITQMSCYAKDKIAVLAWLKTNGTTRNLCYTIDAKARRVTSRAVLALQPHPDDARSTPTLAYGICKTTRSLVLLKRRENALALEYLSLPD